MEGGGKKDVAARVRRVKSKRKSRSKSPRRRSPRRTDALRSADFRVLINAMRKPQSIVIKRAKVESPRVRLTGYANNPKEGCTIKLTDYYHASVRAQPPYSASACCGQVRRGNDGRYWTSVENGNKCKWVA